MKTIKQIADELGVSKQKVYRFIVRNHITASSEVKQSKLYDEATEMLIKQGILEDEPYQNHIMKHIKTISMIRLVKRL